MPRYMWVDEYASFAEALDCRPVPCPQVIEERITVAANFNFNEVAWTVDNTYAEVIQPIINQTIRAHHKARERRDREFAHAVLGIHL